MIHLGLLLAMVVVVSSIGWECLWASWYHAAVPGPQGPLDKFPVVTAGSMSQPQTSLPLPKVMYVVTPAEAEDVVPDAWGAGTRLARRCAYTALHIQLCLAPRPTQSSTW